MITVAARRLHVAVQISPRLDLLDFMRSVVAGLLKNSRIPASSGPSGRRFMIHEQQFWPALPCQCRESRRGHRNNKALRVVLKEAMTS